MNVCRLCGEQKSPLDFHIELADKTSANWSYRELIEYHTRVPIKSNKLLPQSVCEECRIEIDGFADFSLKLQSIQSSFDVATDELDPPAAIQDCFVLLEEGISESAADEFEELDDVIDKGLTDVGCSFDALN